MNTNTLIKLHKVLSGGRLTSSTRDRAVELVIQACEERAVLLSALREAYVAMPTPSEAAKGSKAYALDMARRERIEAAIAMVVKPNTNTRRAK